MRFYLIGYTSVSVHAPVLANPRLPRFSSALYIRAASARVVLPSAIKHRKTGSHFGLRRQTLLGDNHIRCAVSSHNDCSERFKCHTLVGRHVHVNTSRRHRWPLRPTTNTVTRNISVALKFNEFATTMWDWKSTAP